MSYKNGKVRCGETDYMWWIRFMNFARDEKETNVEIYRENGVFYCQTVKDITKGEELLVWFEKNLCNELGLTKNEKLEEGQYFTILSKVLLF